MSAASKAQASVTYFDSVNFSSTERTAVVNWVNKEATALSNDATPKAYKRKYIAEFSKLVGKSNKLYARIELTDSTKWDSTTRSSVVSWLQAVATQLTNDATPKAFRREQVIFFKKR